jgi:hypothetical protein
MMDLSKNIQDKRVWIQNPKTKRSRYSPLVQHWARGWRIGGSSPGRGWEFFSLPLRPDRLWGPPHPPIQWVPGSLSLGVKQPGSEADHSSSLMSMSKNARSYTSTRNTPSWCAQFYIYIYIYAWCFMVVGHGVLTGRNELLIHDNKVLRKILELLLSLLRISPWGLFRVRINF